MHPRRLAIILILSGLSFSVTTADAYVGPGAGLPIIGMLIALVGAIVLAIVGFIWYPVRRFLRNKKREEEQGESTSDEHHDESSTT
ncbi:MAG: FeoB-associated Cys-rich membrane protein [Pseudomonadota bacterium]